MTRRQLSSRTLGFALGIAALLSGPIAWAQVNTNEGGGQEYIDRLYATRRAFSCRDGSRQRTRPAPVAPQDTEGQLQCVRAMQMVEDARRKLGELERRLRMLESQQHMESVSKNKR